MLDALMPFQYKKFTVYQQRHKPYHTIADINNVFFVCTVVTLRLEPITSGSQCHWIIIHDQKIAKLANKSTSNEI